MTAEWERGGNRLNLAVCSPSAASSLNMRGGGGNLMGPPVRVCREASVAYSPSRGRGAWFTFETRISPVPALRPRPRPLHHLCFRSGVHLLHGVPFSHHRFLPPSFGLSSQTDQRQRESDAPLPSPLPLYPRHSRSMAVMRASESQERKLHG